MTLRSPIPLFLLVLFTMPPGAPALAADQEAAGRVTMLQGQADAQAPSGARRQLARGAQVFAGEIIVTQPGARLQLRLADTAVLGLHAGTRIHLEAVPAAGGDEPVRYRLERGGFITTGGMNPFRVETTLALVEGEGTAECFKDVQLYCGVYAGGLRLSNGRGTLELGIGAGHDFAQVPTADTPPIGLLSRPQELAGTAAASGTPANYSGTSVLGPRQNGNTPTVIPLDRAPGFSEPQPIVVTPIKQ